EPSLFALGVFVREKVKRFVFLNWAAERKARLRARVPLLDRNKGTGRGVHLTRKRIARLKSLVAEKAEGITVKIVAAAFGEHAHDAARRAAILRVVVAENELEFLDRFLRNRRANAVHRVVHRVSAVNADHVRTRASPVYVEAAVWSRADGGGNVARRLG